ncbi:LANO_0H18866g1_1 [Lachancea nothofagi CBS 11611]|uniref:DNA topoisomerase (ATP-hydrolyzing) n=1 Tax=Lachancea nothofagi CBS 11611 TaxID=1266666 RepID=A0A1G4KN33_9SACH|nr:LANO_0H18866g1_1 [Lachancea nothofagi CBS 11611]
MGGKMKIEPGLKPSLGDYLERSPTRATLEEALSPKTREIVLTKIQEPQNLKSEICTILSLMKNAIEQQSEPLVIFVGSRGKLVKPAMCFPYYGFEKMKGPPAFKTSVLLSLLKCVAMKMENEEICTIRDVFYLNVELYKNQQVVAEWLRAIADAFELPHFDALRIVAAQKGLCCTPVNLNFDVDKVILKNQKSLVPYLTAATEFSGDWSLVERVIVLEKDAIFSKLAENTQVSKRCMLVTGKGYPDWLTRYFLYKMMLNCPPSVIFEIYTDSDPYGIDIAVKYMHNELKATYQCPRLVYKGVLIQELIDNRSSTRGLQLLDLSFRDRTYAMNLLKRIAATTLRKQTKHALVQEVQRQLFYQKKAEMNTVNGANFAEYFLAKLNA